METGSDVEYSRPFKTERGRFIARDKRVVAWRTRPQTTHGGDSAP